MQRRRRHLFPRRYRGRSRRSVHRAILPAVRRRVLLHVAVVRRIRRPGPLGGIGLHLRVRVVRRIDRLARRMESHIGLRRERRRSGAELGRVLRGVRGRNVRCGGGRRRFRYRWDRGARLLFELVHPRPPPCVRGGLHLLPPLHGHRRHLHGRTGDRREGIGPIQYRHDYFESFGVGIRIDDGRRHRIRPRRESRPVLPARIAGDGPGRRARLLFVSRIRYGRVPVRGGDRSRAEFAPRHRRVAPRFHVRVRVYIARRGGDDDDGGSGGGCSHHQRSSGQRVLRAIGAVEGRCLRSVPVLFLLPRRPTVAVPRIATRILRRDLRPDHRHLRLPDGTAKNILQHGAGRTPLPSVRASSSRDGRPDRRHDRHRRRRRRGGVSRRFGVAGERHLSGNVAGIHVRECRSYFASDASFRCCGRRGGGERGGGAIRIRR
mmetsp:Transcript_49024/g.147657  ORF Transcript_49024/g.147657 Transcript_49024/m.147657 type:complete len:433 (-) Transcript_49024:245-1543(-)